jgi:hypothetical protein
MMKGIFSRFARPSRLLTLFLVLVLLAAGCAVQPPVQVDLQAIRTEMGAVGVVAAEFEPTTFFEGYARGKASGAGQAASALAVDWMGEGLATAHPYGLLTHILVLPAVVVGGGVYGAVVAEPKAHAGTVCEGG